jgi:hypothetical protein
MENGPSSNKRLGPPGERLSGRGEARPDTGHAAGCADGRGAADNRPKIRRVRSEPFHVAGNHEMMFHLYVHQSTTTGST